MIERQRIVEIARQWIGVKYRHQGRTRENGVDCIGLIIVVGEELGCNTKGIPSKYSKNPNGNLLLDNAKNYLKPTAKKFEDMQIGDVAVLWGYTRHTPQHFAVVGEWGGRLTMIHALSKNHEVVEHGWDRFWQQRLEMVYEFPDTVQLTARGA